MDQGNNSHSQFELFPGASDGNNTPKPSGANILREIKLNGENLIVVAIVFLMVSIVTFSLGVERGKRLVDANAQDTDEINTLQKSNIEVISEAQKQEIETASIVVNKSEIDRSAPAEEKIEVLKIPEIDIEPEPLVPNYTIQVASFKLERNAQKEASSLKNNGFEAHVLPKGDYSIVCVGKFDRRDQAKEYSGKLRSKYKDLMVRRM